MLIILPACLSHSKRVVGTIGMRAAGAVVVRADDADIAAGDERALRIAALEFRRAGCGCRQGDRSSSLALRSSSLSVFVAQALAAGREVRQQRRIGLDRGIEETATSGMLALSWMSGFGSAARAGAMHGSARSNSRKQQRCGRHV